MKKVLAFILVAGLLLGCTITGFAVQPATTEYIDLQGDWHFKLYRKYSNMFQYLAHNRCTVTWQDEDTAEIPEAGVYSEWESVQTPSPNYATGGLLQMTRDGSTVDDRTQLLPNDLFPKWSEAWMCKTIDLPVGFLQEDKVTLLLGIVDDMDVVYINGTPVAASGFVAADGRSSVEVPALGGFVQGGDFRFEKSYWEVSREYEIPAAYFTEGENEIAIRVYNNNSFGGFYDRTMALCATKKAVRALKGLPTQELVSNQQVAATVAEQVNALQSKDIEAFAATLYDGFVEDGVNKEKKLEEWTALFEEYDTITVTDSDAGYYQDKDKTRCYSASRVVAGANASGSVVLFSDKEWLQSFVSIDGAALERGNWSRCYSVTYPSQLMNNNLMYSIYLPKSYYTNPDRSYPVVYLLHGINSTGKSFVDVDRIESKLDSWINGGKVVETIVVMPNSGKNSFYTDTPLPSNGVGSDTAGPWASHITSEIRSEIENNYRTLNEARFRGITGISMGGGGAFKLGCENPELYSSIASHMGAVSNTTIEIMDTLTDEQLKNKVFYLDCGNQDTMVNPANTKLVGEYLQGRSAQVDWSLRDGGHNSAFYMDGMPRSMEMHSKHFVTNGLYDIWGIDMTPTAEYVPNEANSPRTLDTIASAAAALRREETKLPAGAVMAENGKTALVKINLYSDQPSLSLETLELLAQSKDVGLSVSIDGGKANMVFLGGFEPKFESGRLTYPLYYGEDTPNVRRILEASNGDAAQSFKLGGSMRFPTEVKASVKTNLPSGEAVYLYCYNGNLGRFEQINGATVENGMLTFTTRWLGEFLVTLKPL